MIFKKNPDVIARAEGSQLLVFQQETGLICILNPSSRSIWESLTGNVSSEEIVDRLREKYTVPEPGTPLHNLVDTHLHLMHAARLVETVES